MSIVHTIINEQNLFWAWEKIMGYYRTMENAGVLRMEFLNRYMTGGKK